MHGSCQRRGKVTSARAGVEYPFRATEPVRLIDKVLDAVDLPTRAEVLLLLQHAGKEADILRVYYATGARTGELLAARVGNWQSVTRKIVLAQHKRTPGRGDDL